MYCFIISVKFFFLIIFFNGKLFTAANVIFQFPANNYCINKRTSSIVHFKRLIYNDFF